MWTTSKLIWIDVVKQFDKSKYEFNNEKLTCIDRPDSCCSQCNEGIPGLDDEISWWRLPIWFGNESVVETHTLSEAKLNIIWMVSSVPIVSAMCIVCVCGWMRISWKITGLCVYMCGREDQHKYQQWWSQFRNWSCLPCRRTSYPYVYCR